MPSLLTDDWTDKISFKYWNIHNKASFPQKFLLFKKKKKKK